MSKNPNEGVVIQDLGWEDKLKSGKFDHGYHTLVLKKRRNTRSVLVGVWLVTNPESRDFGRFWLNSWLNGYQSYYADTVWKAKRVADRLLKRFCKEIESGKRNWWTLKLQEGRPELVA